MPLTTGAEAEKKILSWANCKKKKKKKMTGLII